MSIVIRISPFQVEDILIEGDSPDHEILLFKTYHLIRSYLTSIDRTLRKNALKTLKTKPDIKTLLTSGGQQNAD